LAPSPAPPARATGTKNKPRSPRLPQDSAFHRASTTILVHPSNHQPLPQPASTKAPKHHSTHTYRLSIVKEQAARRCGKQDPKQNQTGSCEEVRL